jgi:hypothetical protein
MNNTATATSYEIRVSDTSGRETVYRNETRRDVLARLAETCTDGNAYRLLGDLNKGATVVIAETSFRTVTISRNLSEEIRETA